MKNAKKRKHMFMKKSSSLKKKNISKLIPDRRRQYKSLRRYYVKINYSNKRTKISEFVSQCFLALKRDCKAYFGRPLFRVGGH